MSKPHKTLETIGSEVPPHLDELLVPAGSGRLEVRRNETGVMGVFSLRRIPAGRLVESCPVLHITPTDVRAASGHQSIAVEWSGDYALLFGYGSLYRESSEPNAFFVPDYAAGTARLFALQEILPEQEVLVSFSSASLRRANHQDTHPTEDTAG